MKFTVIMGMIDSRRDTTYFALAFFDIQIVFSG